MWRLDDQHQSGGWNSGWGYGSNGPRGFRQLPEVIRIERERRELRVESPSGRLLRAIALRGGELRDGQVQVVTNRFGGTRITETFSLRRRGQELVVHTSVQGPRGARQFISVYDRA